MLNKRKMPRDCMTSVDISGGFVDYWMLEKFSLPKISITGGILYI